MIEIAFALFAAAGGTTDVPFTPVPPAPNEDAIIVKGEADGQARRQSEIYLQALGIPDGDQQASRWFDPICPRAIGVLDPVRTIVEGQVRETIRSIGAPLAAPHCTPNLIVAFTDDAPKLMERLHSDDPAIGSELSPPAVKALTSGSQAIRWWYMTEVRSRDGASASSAELPWVKVETDGGVGTLPSTGRSLPVYGSSLIATQSIRSIKAAVVVVDVTRATGFKLKPVVDYVSLVALAETKPGAAPARSVLSLFLQPNSGIAGLTSRDLSFLHTLYSISMDRPSSQQRRTLVRAMARDSREH